MKIIAKITNEARTKMGLRSEENASFTGVLHTVTDAERNAKRNPRTPYIAI